MGLYRDVLMVSLALLVVLQVCLVTAAPAGVVRRQPSRMLSAILNDQDQDTESALKLRRPRNKRHAQVAPAAVDGGDDDSIIELPNGERIDLRHLNRHRRSAIWLLSATISLCNSHPSTCQSINISEGDLQMELRLLEQ